VVLLAESEHVKQGGGYELLPVIAAKGSGEAWELGDQSGRDADQRGLTLEGVRPSNAVESDCPVLPLQLWAEHGDVLLGQLSPVSHLIISLNIANVSSKTEGKGGGGDFLCPALLCTMSGNLKQL